MAGQAFPDGERASRSAMRRLPARGLLLPGLAWSVAAGAAPPPETAERAVAAQQEGLRNVILPPCRHGGEEIVVCGRRSDRERVPFPDQSVAGARTHLLPGEAPSAVTAMNQADPPCNTAGAPRCGFSISFITVGIVLFKVGKHVIDPDSDPPPTPIGAETTPPD